MCRCLISRRVLYETKFSGRIIASINFKFPDSTELTMATLPTENPYPEPQRLSFPYDEKRHQWLPMLLDIYHITDRGVREGILREEKKGRNLACHKGCSSCCKTHTSIPVYPLEITGLYWYIIEQVEGELRNRLKQQCAEHQSGHPCPFLVDGACGVHPMRPQACRHFNVFTTPCEEGEDAYYTRRKDVLTPIKKFKEEAMLTMLPFHDVKGRAQKREAIKTGLVHRYVQVLQEVDWSKFSHRIS